MCLCEWEIIYDITLNNCLKKTAKTLLSLKFIEGVDIIRV